MHIVGSPAIASMSFCSGVAGAAIKLHQHSIPNSTLFITAVIANPPAAGVAIPARHRYAQALAGRPAIYNLDDGNHHVANAPRDGRVDGGDCRAERDLASP